MSRLCRCGAIVDGRCQRCSKPKAIYDKKTKERGYGHDWRTFSERYRANHPLCEVCLLEDRVTGADEVHHIIKIVDAPERRMDMSNVLAVCKACHERVENKQQLARAAKSHSYKMEREW